ncbi:phosphatidylcholine:ceramide cholinephosphotransferase 1 [Malurus melanocephalus]|uniref:phosphatidylcholine:ceramide cholinephosphotransferase 1 n=1 Tax=Malurus melanocephalus TaxID=175006 RepID=UPI002549A428|nr:phosphatidylcholine:ceramide cholinephosphotransferase 1 [Malurus melanocephalus]
MKEVVLWSPEEVAGWLTDNAVPEYCEPLRSFTGRDLINLTEEDFQKSPLCRVSSDSGQRLLNMIEGLKMAHHMEAHKNGHANGHVRAGDAARHNGFGAALQLNGVPNGFKKEMIKIPMPEPERSQYPMEWGKTFLAFIYALFCFVFTTVTISVVHERVPPKEVQPPLPDAFFDRFDRVQWAFSICEINGMILVGLWFVQWLLLKYNSECCLLNRREISPEHQLQEVQSIKTLLSRFQPSSCWKCAGKSCGFIYLLIDPVGQSRKGEELKGQVAGGSCCWELWCLTVCCALLSPQLFGDWESHLRRIMKLIAGGGLSITGSHNMCGDYLYSGHTVILTLTYLFIKEYSPRRLWWYHWLCWALSVVGMFCILLAHDHYTVDVVVAYYITTRLFWWYHTMANQQVLKEASQTNLLARVWWYKPFQYFEKNVQGIVPRSYHWPLRCPALARGRPVKYSRLLSAT